MKKTINETNTLDEFLESNIESKEGFDLYKQKLVECGQENADINYILKYILVQYVNFKCPKEQN